MTLETGPGWLLLLRDLLSGDIDNSILVLGVNVGFFLGGRFKSLVGNPFCTGPHFDGLGRKLAPVPADHLPDTGLKVRVLRRIPFDDVAGDGAPRYGYGPLRTGGLLDAAEVLEGIPLGEGLREVDAISFPG